MITIQRRESRNIFALPCGRKIYLFRTDWVTLERDTQHMVEISLWKSGSGAQLSGCVARFCLITVDLFVSSFFPLSIEPH